MAEPRTGVLGVEENTLEGVEEDAKPPPPPKAR